MRGEFARGAGMIRPVVNRRHAEEGGLVRHGRAFAYVEAALRHDMVQRAARPAIKMMVECGRQDSLARDMNLAARTEPLDQRDEVRIGPARFSQIVVGAPADRAEEEIIRALDPSVCARDCRIGPKVVGMEIGHLLDPGEARRAPLRDRAGIGLRDVELSDEWPGEPGLQAGGVRRVEADRWDARQRSDMRDRDPSEANHHIGSKSARHAEYGGVARQQFAREPESAAPGARGDPVRQAELVEQVARDVFFARGDQHLGPVVHQPRERVAKEQHIRRMDDVDEDLHARF